VNRQTRDKVVSGTNQANLTTGNACWETAPRVFQKLNEDFGPFDIDICADQQRALCRLWYGPGSELCEDALLAPWHDHGRKGYDNPPYGRFIQKILAKAVAEVDAGFTSVHLLPLRITKAFKEFAVARAADILLPDKRLVFFENGVPRCTASTKRGKPIPDTSVFDSVIVRFAPDASAQPRLGVWKVPPHVTAQDLERVVQRRAAASLEEMCVGVSQ
jgi:hypothetical protein